MKRTATTFFVLIFIVVLSRSINAQMSDTTSYKDGTYTGSSRASYTSEPYWGIVKLTVKNNQLTEIKFGIRDSSLHENFDGNYEKHFAGNDVYIQQSRNDWRGVQTYPVKLSEIQDINKVDAVTGATWSHNIFKASVKEALKNAR